MRRPRHRPDRRDKRCTTASGDERPAAAGVAGMTSRTFTAGAATTAMALAVTACGSASEPESAPTPDLTSWAADNVPVPAEGGFSTADIAAPDGARASDSIPDVEPGWYAITVACELTESEAADEDRSAHIVFSGESGVYGGGSCPRPPITTTTYVGIPDEPAPETFSEGPRGRPGALLGAVRVTDDRPRVALPERCRGPRVCGATGREGPS